MGLVVVRLELVEQRLELRLVQLLVDLRVEQPLHLVEVRRVEPRRQQRLLYRRLPRLLRLLGGHSSGGGGNAEFEMRVPNNWSAEWTDGIDRLDQGELGGRRHVCFQIRALKIGILAFGTFTWEWEGGYGIRCNMVIDNDDDDDFGDWVPHPVKSMCSNEVLTRVRES